MSRDANVTPARPPKRSSLPVGDSLAQPAIKSNEPSGSKKRSTSFINHKKAQEAQKPGPPTYHPRKLREALSFCVFCAFLWPRRAVLFRLEAAEENLRRALGGLRIQTGFEVVAELPVG